MTSPSGTGKTIGATTSPATTEETPAPNHRAESGRGATIIHDLGWAGVRFLDDLGQLGVFTGNVLRAVVTPPVRFRLFVDEIFKLGVLSLVIICICGVAVGMVLGLQGYNTLARFGATESLGAVVGLSLVRELGPVLTALLATGRAGSATTAEIGTMVATEQLDGLRMMSIDPIHLVVTPKALAMIVVMPLLSALFIVCGLFGGYLVGVRLMGVDGGSYISGLESAVEFTDDVLGSMLKALVFGVLVGLIATYRGYRSEPTSAGVSAATTSTVVVASVSVLISDYFITALWGV
jgi:phospholipid/cholesterol/gamma-HCH transport system permease protein